MKSHIVSITAANTLRFHGPLSGVTPAPEKEKGSMPPEAVGRGQTVRRVSKTTTTTTTVEQSETVVQHVGGLDSMEC